MVLEIGGRSPYSCCFVGCSFQNLFSIVRSSLMQILSSFLSIRLVTVHVVWVRDLHDIFIFHFQLSFLRKICSRFWFTFLSNSKVLNKLDIFWILYFTCFDSRERKLRKKKKEDISLPRIWFLDSRYTQLENNSVSYPAHEEFVW